jgi:hypothetical protein
MYTTKVYRIWLLINLKNIHLEERERDGKMASRPILGIQVVEIGSGAE